MSKLTLNEVRGLGETTYKNLPRGLASAWANLNGTGTPALRDSENVSSVVDNGTGDYTKNLSNAMANSDYSVIFGISANIIANFGRNANISVDVPTSTSFRVRTASATPSLEDILYVNSQIMGDLA